MLGSLWRRIERVVVAVVGVSLVLLAVVYDGVPAAEVELNDGGVWVTNSSKLLLGHINVESRTMDGGLRVASSEFDVTQFANNVIVHDPVSVQPVDTAALAMVGQSQIDGVTVSHGGDLVLVASPAVGNVWITDTAGAGGFSDSAEPLVAELDSPRVVAGLETTGFVVSADGSVLRIERQQGAEAVVSEAGSIGVELEAADQLTVVGDKLAVFDASESQVLVDGKSVSIEAGDQVQLQAASVASEAVIVASETALVEVPVSGGNPVYHEVSAGVPAQPVQVAGCSYGAWSGSGAFVRACSDEALNELANYPEIAGSSALAFRVNREIVLLNDAASGAVYLPADSMERIDDWDLVDSQLEEEEREENEDSAETDESVVADSSDEQHPPEAQDDEFGARAGTSTVLPVLLNDLDIDGDVLTAEIEEAPEGYGIAPAKDGRAISIAPQGDASGVVTFKYRAFDGKEYSNTATVKVQVHSAAENGAPQRVRKNSIHLSERATVQYAVLPDWVDPDGDPIYLQSAVGQEGLAVTFRQDGYISVRDLGTAGAGRRIVTVVVSDGQQSTTEDIVVQVSSGATNHPPIANNDHVVINVGDEVTISPLSNDQDPDGDEIKLTEVGTAPKDTTVSPDYVRGLFSFKADTAGSRELTYTISDGPAIAHGRVRVDVLDPKEADEVPSAQNDLALLRTNSFTVADVLSNDFDPAGRVLVIQSVNVDPSTGLSVQVVGHSRLRVSSSTGLEEPVTFEYTISNGMHSATAKVLVLPMEAGGVVQPPVAVDDETVVRVGDIVSVDVLANDYSPSDLDLFVLSELEVRSAPGLGEAFVSGDRVRFKAGDSAGQALLTYTVRDSDGNVASAGVKITIREFDERNRQPEPKLVTARTFSGRTERIAIPTDGIDPDGDSVELVGVGDNGPLFGSVKVDGNFLVYTAGADAVGTDSFTYSVKDRFGAVGQAAIRIGVVPEPAENQAPVAVTDIVSVRPEKKLEIPVTKNDVDPDGDKILILADSVRGVDDSWQPEAKIVGQLVQLEVPSDPGIYQFYYDITDGGGAPVTGVVTLNVDPEAPLLPPVAIDDHINVSETSGKQEVSVDVLVNDSDLDGLVEDLTISVEEPAEVVNGQVVVPLADDRQVVLYEITDIDGLSSKAAIIVPGADQIPPYLDPDKIPLVVKGGEPAIIDFDELVLTREGHRAILTSVDSVIAGAGGLADDPNLGLEVLGEKKISFTPDTLFIGSTSVAFEVTDGDTVDDPRGLVATLSVPIQVESSGLFPPQLRPSEVTVAPGEDAITARLSEMVDDPDPGDNEKMAYSIVSINGPIEATITGQNIDVATPADTPPGSTGSIVVKVHDGSTDPLEMTVPVSVITSSRPLMNVSDLVENEARVGQPVSFDLSQVITNPFADRGGEITVVGQPQVDGPATASVNGLTLTITPTDIVTDMLVTYVVQDATHDASRQRTGTVRLTVKDNPEPPINVSARATQSQTAEVSWEQGNRRGGTISGFTVHWNNGSQDCGLQTTCVITGLANNNNYTFTVTQTTEVNTSVPSAASNQVWVDVRPNTPTAPRASFGDQKIDLEWDEAEVPDGGSPVTEYVIEVSPPVAGQTQKTVAGTSYTWTGLTNGTAYSFRLQAKNKHEDPSEWGPQSAPEIPAGAPSNIAAPSVTKDAAAAGVAPRANVSWNPPANPNGDNSFNYELRETGSSTVLCSGSATSCAVTMDVSTQDRTFEVRATNKSQLWSEWSPASNAVRAFQPPSAPGSFSLTATGKSHTVRFSFTAASGNGARSNEISYRWDARGQHGTISNDGTVTNATAFPNGTNTQVTLRAISTVNGETAEGPTATATVNAYGPPNPPTVSAASNWPNVKLSWSSPASSNGRSISTMQVATTDTGTKTRSLSGNRTEGNGPAQQKCVKARVQNSEGQWSSWSSKKCGTTQGNGSVDGRLGGWAPNGTRPFCTASTPCKWIEIRLDNWYPGKKVACTYKYGSESGTAYPTVNGGGDWGWDRFHATSGNATGYWLQQVALGTDPGSPSCHYN